MSTRSRGSESSASWLLATMVFVSLCRGTTQIAKNFVNSSTPDLRPTFVVNFDTSTVICQHSSDPTDLHIHNMSSLCDGKQDCFVNPAMHDEVFPYCEHKCESTCSGKGACLYDGAKPQCYCDSGFSGAACELQDKNECLEHPCHMMAQCQNTLGSYECRCLPGYQGNGHECTDIDECAGKAGCPEHSQCINLPGTYYCNCTQGFSPKGNQGSGLDKCADINECETGAHNCEKNEICENTIGSFKCVTKCSPGYELIDGKCEDVNECSSAKLHKCDVRAECVNTVGGYECECEEGFDGDGKNCQPKSSCRKNSGICDRHASCHIVLDICDCKTGYTGDGITCHDINECDAKETPCSAGGRCLNLDGGYVCCKDGQDDQACIKDQGAFCSGGCGDNAICSNSTCECISGFRGDPKKKCVDINECVENDSICGGVGDRCVNLFGGFKCCQHGSTDPECSTDQAFSSDSSTISSHGADFTTTGEQIIEGSGSIQTSSGGTITVTRGVIPKEVELTTSGKLACTSYCPANSECVEGFCECVKGYGGNALVGCEDIDECITETCDEEANEWCVNLIGGFVCCNPTNATHDDCLGLEITREKGLHVIGGNEEDTVVAARSNHSTSDQLITQVIQQSRNFSSGQIILTRGKVPNGEAVTQTTEPDEFGLEISAADLAGSGSGVLLTTVEPMRVEGSGKKTGVWTEEDDGEDDDLMEEGSGSWSTTVNGTGFTGSPRSEGTIRVRITTLGEDGETETATKPGVKVPGEKGEAGTSSGSSTSSGEGSGSSGSTTSSGEGSGASGSSTTSSEGSSTSGTSGASTTSSEGSATSGTESGATKPSEGSGATSGSSSSSTASGEGSGSSGASTTSSGGSATSVTESGASGASGSSESGSSGSITSSGEGSGSSGATKPSGTSTTSSEGSATSSTASSSSTASGEGSGASGATKPTGTPTTSSEGSATSEASGSSTSSGEGSGATKPTQSRSGSSSGSSESPKPSGEVEGSGSPSSSGASKTPEDNLAVKKDGEESTSSGATATSSGKPSEGLETSGAIVPEGSGEWFETGSKGHFESGSKVTVTSGKGSESSEGKGPLKPSGTPGSNKGPLITTDGEDSSSITSGGEKGPKGDSKGDKPTTNDKDQKVGGDKKSDKEVEGSGNGPKPSIEGSGEPTDVPEGSGILTTSSGGSNATFEHGTKLEKVPGASGAPGAPGSSGAPKDSSEVGLEIKKNPDSSGEIGLEIVWGSTTEPTDSDNVGLEISGIDLAKSTKHPIEGSGTGDEEITATTRDISKTKSTKRPKIEIDGGDNGETSEVDGKPTSPTPAPVTSSESPVTPDSGSGEVPEGSGETSSSAPESTEAPTSAPEVSPTSSAPAPESTTSSESSKTSEVPEGSGEASSTTPESTKAPEVEGSGKTPEASETTTSKAPESTSSTSKAPESATDSSATPPESLSTLINTSPSPQSATITVPSQHREEPRSTKDTFALPTTTTTPAPEIEITKCTSSDECGMDALCERRTGVCRCEPGFEGAPPKKECVDVDECATGDHKCHDSARCQNFIGGYACFCPTGFRKTDDGSCEDIDECHEHNSTCCGANAHCVNKPGTYNCECETGFLGDGYHCVPNTKKPCDSEQILKSHCAESNMSCEVETSNGAVECRECMSGYKKVGTTCEDVNECEMASACSENANCVNLNGTFSCSCKPGFRGDGFMCTDINECDEKHPCHPLAECTNSEGSFKCECHAGFEGDGFKCTNPLERSCEDVEKFCGRSEHVSCLSVRIYNGSLSSVCECEPGFRFDKATNECVDIDECDENRNNCDPASAVCVNTEGSFRCECAEGYEGEGGVCTDIDECDRGMAGCDSMAMCINRMGSCGCKCMAGYTGDGAHCTKLTPEPLKSDKTTCTDEWSRLCELEKKQCTVDEEEVPQCGACLPGHHPINGTCQSLQISGLCAQKNDCNKHAECIDILPDSHFCSCPDGFIGDGMMCDDVDECTNAGMCEEEANTQCENTIGSFKCICVAGFRRDGDHCVPEKKQPNREKIEVDEEGSETTSSGDKKPLKEPKGTVSSESTEAPVTSSGTPESVTEPSSVTSSGSSEVPESTSVPSSEASKAPEATTVPSTSSGAPESNTKSSVPSSESTKAPVTSSGTSEASQASESTSVPSSESTTSPSVSSTSSGTSAPESTTSVSSGTSPKSPESTTSSVTSSEVTKSTSTSVSTSEASSEATTVSSTSSGSSESTTKSSEGTVTSSESTTSSGATTPESTVSSKSSESPVSSSQAPEVTKASEATTVPSKSSESSTKASESRVPSSKAPESTTTPSGTSSESPVTKSTSSGASSEPPKATTSSEVTSESTTVPSTSSESPSSESTTPESTSEATSSGASSEAAEVTTVSSSEAPKTSSAPESSSEATTVPSTSSGTSPKSPESSTSSVTSSGTPESSFEGTVTSSVTTTSSKPVTSFTKSPESSTKASESPFTSPEVPTSSESTTLSLGDLVATSSVQPLEEGTSESTPTTEDNLTVSVRIHELTTASESSPEPSESTTTSSESSKPSEEVTSSVTKHGRAPESSTVSSTSSVPSEASPRSSESTKPSEATSESTTSPSVTSSELPEASTKTSTSEVSSTSSVPSESTTTSSVSSEASSKSPESTKPTESTVTSSEPVSSTSEAPVTSSGAPKASRAPQVSITVPPSKSSESTTSSAAPEFTVSSKSSESPVSSSQAPEVTKASEATTVPSKSSESSTKASESTTTSSESTRVRLITGTPDGVTVPSRGLRQNVTNSESVTSSPVPPTSTTAALSATTSGHRGPPSIQPPPGMFTSSTTEAPPTNNGGYGEENQEEETTPTTTTTTSEAPSLCQNITCHSLATCEPSSGTCICRDGFIGDGLSSCSKKSSADCISLPSLCAENAKCDNSTRSCECSPGYIGDGYVCSPHPQDCVLRKNLCSPEAICQNRRCQCLPGFTGDGVKCVSIHERASNCSQCDENAHCVGGTSCKCNPGYFGNGLCCVPDPLDCVHFTGICHPNAVCNQKSRQCECSSGFSGNGVSCFPQKSCRTDASVCAKNAICLPTGHCICRHGFKGDPFYKCSPLVAKDPASHTDLSDVSSCATPCDKSSQLCISGECICKPGFRSNSTSDSSCEDIDECAEKSHKCDRVATCQNTKGSHICTCPDGFIGDGTTCVPHVNHGKLSVYCEADGMTLVLGNDTSDFEGKIFVKGQAENPHCSKSFSSLLNSHKPYVFKVAFQHCDVQLMENHTMASTVVVQKHAMFLTNKADSYDLRCQYPIGSRAVESHVNVSELATTSTLTDKNSTLAPICRLSVSNDQQLTISSATVGDTLKLALEVTPNENFGILPRNCFAVNIESGERYTLTDDMGCAIDESLFPQWSVATTSKVQAVFRTFKWPDSSMIRFQCDCAPCVGQCSTPSCISSARFRRHHTNTPIISEDIRQELVLMTGVDSLAVSSIINVHDSSEMSTSPSEDISITSSSSICVKMAPLLIALSSFAVCSAILLYLCSRKPKTVDSELSF